MTDKDTQAYEKLIMALNTLKVLSEQTARTLKNLSEYLRELTENEET